MTFTRALITGAGGFVGARLAEQLLDRGLQPTLLVRPGSDHWRLAHLRAAAEVLEVDLRDLRAVHRALDSTRPECVFHLAAHGAYSWHDDPRAILEINLMGTLSLLEAATQSSVSTFVHAGSSSEYGFKDHAPSESEAPEPNSYYAVAKTAATLLGQYMAAQHDLRVTTLRLSSVYGPWEEPRRLVPTLISRGLCGELPPLVEPETGRDFVFVDDVCDAFLAVATADRPTSAIYNVGSGIQTTVRELVEVARRELVIEIAPHWGAYPARPWDARVWVSDPRRIQRDLGWHPSHDLHRGFSATVAWLREQPDVWERYGLLDRHPARPADASA
ncbi:MAG: NAD-dependent epimerase/dehydratase family protein [Sciscionella sp.]